MRTQDWRRYAAPAAFLLAVTIAVALIRSGMNAGKSPSSTAVVTSTSTSTSARTQTQSTPAKKTKKPPARRYWTVQAGDTFAVISSKTGVPLSTIARLNPKVSSTSLFIGERIRIK